jgi:hypothetical protein
MTPRDPALIWDLDPAVLPPATTTCNTSSPCLVTGPMQIAYTLRDDYGNTSPGIITVKPWNALIPSANYVSMGDTIFLGSAEIRMDTQLAGTVVSTQSGSATVQIGDGANMTLATPPDSTIVTGDAVSVRVSPPPLTVAGNVPPNICTTGIDPADPDGGEKVVCSPTQCPSQSTAGASCLTSSFASVTVSAPATSGAGSAPPETFATAFSGLCGVLQHDASCPLVLWDGSVTPPAVVRKDDFYSFTYQAHSTAQEDLTFSHTAGQLPPGLTLSSNGVLSGTPTTPGVYTFTLFPVGNTSGVAAFALTNTVQITN